MIVVDETTQKKPRIDMKKFSHRGGVVGRRTRALERLKKVKKPNNRELKEIEILEKRIKE
tara:strand:+ start:97 stop:276 length:180 start_codon:yes stop_codon:yes gene_type:complete